MGRGERAIKHKNDLIKTSIATILAFAFGARITAAAGIRFAVQSIFAKGFKFYSLCI